MDYPYGPQLKKKAHPLVKTIEIASQIAFPTDEGDPEPDPVSPHWVARKGSEEWGEFARERGFSYRDELPAADFVGDPRLKSFFDELRELRYPLNSVGGLCEGVWEGVPFTSFYSYNFEAGDSLWPYRFVCTPLAESRPDLVYDRALGRKRPYHLGWYPRHADYVKVNGPGSDGDAPKKAPGLLGRSALVKGVAKTVSGAVDHLLLPKLHTNSRDWAAVIAARPHESAAFSCDWAARGRWLVVFEAVSQYRRTSEENARLLDSLVAVKRLVD
jgi:hypothetical protein